MSNGQKLAACSWGTSLLVKSGILGVGVAVVLWYGWPQSPIRPHDRFSALPVSEPSVVFSASSANRSQTSGAKDEKNISQVGAARLLVDLNLSSRMELETLPGIGVTLADRIVTYRASHGGFDQVEDLVKVSGIGKKRLRKLAPFVKITERKKIS